MYLAASYLSAPHRAVPAFRTDLSIIGLSSHTHSRSRGAWIVGLFALGAVVYTLVAYVALPALWKHFEHERRLAGLPMVTTTAQGISGDPINLAFIGSSRDILCAMHGAGWYPADPVTLRTSIDILGSVLLHRPYPTAPVSALFYAGRREDLAFEMPEGGSADRRHHVRLWQVLDHGDQGRPVWLAAATFDRGVGFSHYTGAVTHHIAPDIDREREVIARGLTQAGLLEARYQVSGVGPTLIARNGGGDLYFTDGEVWVLQLVDACRKRDEPPVIAAPPMVTQFKNQVWKAIADGVRDQVRAVETTRRPS
ncbi:LssY C-terminal domain-containing protein [Bradyrhizobium sp. 2TAF24]|uniref:LssY C-terminal domain-containing protein n=1 Tax=Bradyrhizobium sp. 2TAF24 TaxID=3233011 RepID=UPI003F913BA1